MKTERERVRDECRAAMRRARVAMDAAEQEMDRNPCEDTESAFSVAVDRMEEAVCVFSALQRNAEGSA